MKITDSLCDKSNLFGFFDMFLVVIILPVELLADELVADDILAYELVVDDILADELLVDDMLDDYYDDDGDF